MKPDLLKILVEPVTHARLFLEEGEVRGDEIESGRLVSESTGRVYRIVRGIPRFVATETYAQSFGIQWNKFREVQIDSINGYDFSRRRFDQCTGWTEGQLQGKTVLDAGCGAGRFAEVAAARGATVTALDLSSAVDAAKETLARFPNVNVVQGSILEPPFRLASFDLAYCIGVAQHTPDPARVVAAVTNLVRPGGHFCFAIYGRRPWTKLNAKYLIRPFTRRLSPDLLLKLIEGSMPVLFPLTDALFRLPFVGKMSQFIIPVATYVDRDELPRAYRRKEAVLDTFDMLSPRFDQPMTAAEVEAVFQKLNVSSWTFTRRVPVNCVGTR